MLNANQHHQFQHINNVSKQETLPEVIQVGDIGKLLDRVLLHKNENSIMCRSHNWANHTLSFKLHSVATYQHYSVLMNKSTFLMKL